MKELELLVAAIALAGCSTYQQPTLPFPCGDGTSEQWQIAVPPPNANLLKELAGANPNLPAGRETYPIEQWFSAPSGSLMLCRRDKSSCVGEWWQFESADGKPVIAKQDAWICVTGVWPNSSFKPNPLRGSD
jgi:hypothetical protein